MAGRSHQHPLRFTKTPPFRMKNPTCGPGNCQAHLQFPPIPNPKSPHAQKELCGGVQSRENQSLKQGGELKAEAILLNHSPTFPMHLSCAAPAAVLNK